MNDFERLLRDLQGFDINRILKEVWKEPRVQIEIEALITEGRPTSQLFEKGEDGLGVSLGNYSLTTILGSSSFEGKLSKGQRIDHITLNDKGDYYESHFVVPLLTGFRVGADGQKDDNNLFEVYGKDITLLSEENKIILCNFIQPFFDKHAKRFLPQ